MPGSTTTPGRPDARAGASEHVAFRYTDSVGAAGIRFLSRLNGRNLARSPADASPTSSRTPAARLGADVVSLLLHRRGLAPPTPCRSPGAPVSKLREIFRPAARSEDLHNFFVSGRSQGSKKRTK